MTNSVKYQIDPITPIFMAIIIPILLLAPFLSKAFHMDDTLFLWTANHILTDPLDFYGFNANWYGFEMPMSWINKNPPLASYYIALFAMLFGFNEIVLHIAFLVPAVSVSLGTYYLAKLFCSRPHMAALTAVITPAFLVSGTSIMCDTMMLSFYVWAIVFWIHGLKGSKPLFLLIASLLIVLSALTKYFGMTLIPLLLVYSLVEKKRPGAWILYLAIPVLVLSGYQWLIYSLYDYGILSNVASYSIQVSQAAGKNSLTKALTGLAFTGGCIASAAFYAPMLWDKKYFFTIGTLLLVFFIFLLPELSITDSFIRKDSGEISWGIVFQAALFILSGIHILALAATDVRNNRDAFSVLLFFWVLGIYFFSSAVNWSTNARTILPIAPAVGILVARRIDYLAVLRNKFSSVCMLFPLIPAAMIALTVTQADYSLADCQRSIARILKTEFHEYPKTLWFQGHWGFQYYMEAIGAKPLDVRNSAIKQGDVVIIPANNTNIKKLNSKNFQSVGKKKLMCGRWMAIHQEDTGAGFYSDFWGPLPFVFRTPLPEEYEIFIAQPLIKISDIPSSLIIN